MPVQLPRYPGSICPVLLQVGDQAGLQEELQHLEGVMVKLRSDRDKMEGSIETVEENVGLRGAAGGAEARAGAGQCLPWARSPNPLFAGLLAMRSVAQRAGGPVLRSRAQVKSAKGEVAHPQYDQIEQRYREHLIRLKTTEMANSDLEKYHKARVLSHAALCCTALRWWSQSGAGRGGQGEGVLRSGCHGHAALPPACEGVPPCQLGADARPAAPIAPHRTPLRAPPLHLLTRRPRFRCRRWRRRCWRSTPARWRTSTR